MIIKKILTSIILLSFFSTSSFANAANLLTVEQVYSNSKNQTPVTFDLSKKIISNLSNPKVLEEAQKLNIDIEEEKNRIASLSDQEISEAIKNGNHAGGEVIVISLTTVLLIVIVLLLID